MKDLIPFLDWDKHKPIDSSILWEEKKLISSCPYCNGSNIEDRGWSSTLVGGFPDPNHYTHHQRCRECDIQFLWHHIYRGKDIRRSWYVDFDTKNKIIKGLAGCFESFIYTCKCGGEVTREYLDSETLESRGDFSQSGDLIKYSCQDCKESVVLEKDVYRRQ